VLAKTKILWFVSLTDLRSRDRVEKAVVVAVAVAVKEHEKQLESPIVSILTLLKR
jgi:hypothetical protein